MIFFMLAIKQLLIETVNYVYIKDYVIIDIGKI